MSNGHKFLALFAAVLCTTVSEAHAQYEHCSALYQTATRNLTFGESSYSSLNTIFDDYCESNGERKSSTSSLGIEAVVAKIPISLSGTSGNAQQRFSQFCREYSQVRYTASASTAISDTVVTDALESFNRCIALTQNGVRISHASPTKIESTFSFQFGSSTSYELQGVQTGPNISCEVQNPETKELTPLSRSSNFIFSKNFTVFCNRSPLPGTMSANSAYPRTSVTFASNHGTYSAIYPEEEIYGVQIASLIEKRLLSIESRINDLTTATKANEQKLSAGSKALTDYRSGVGVKVLHVMRGEHRSNAGDGWTWIGCNDVDHYVNQNCPNHNIDKNKISHREGHRCGYDFWVVTCISK